MSQSFELVSPLPPEECARLVNAAISEERRPLFSFSSMFANRPVLGYATPTELRLRKRIPYNNSFQYYLTAQLHAEGSGTCLRGTIDQLRFVRVFLGIWLIGTTLGAVAALVSWGFGARHELLWTPFVMPLFGWALVRVGRRLAQAEPAFLLGFLQETLRAVERSAA